MGHILMWLTSRARVHVRASSLSRVQELEQPLRTEVIARYNSNK